MRNVQGVERKSRDKSRLDNEDVHRKPALKNGIHKSVTALEENIVRWESIAFDIGDFAMQNCILPFPLVAASHKNLKGHPPRALQKMGVKRAHPPIAEADPLCVSRLELALRPRFNV